MENCGYWLYSGSGDVPKISGSIKKIATGSDSGSYDLSGRPVLDWGAQPLSPYTQSHSVVRIFTRAEKGQALTHLEMDFNLASLFHKANTSSVSASFDSSELSTREEIEAYRPWYRMVTPVGTFHHNDLNGVEMDPSVEDDAEYKQQLIDWFGTGSVDRFGPYKFPVGLLRNLASSSKFYRETEVGGLYSYEKTVPTGSDLDWDDTGSYYYVYYKELTFDTTKGFYPTLREDCYVRNGDLFAPTFTSDPEEYGNGTGQPDPDEKDVYYNLHKPTRDEEKAGLFATFSYAPVKVGTQTIIQNPFQTIKVQHTTDEIRYKLANEQVPGTLHIRQNFYVTGSSYMREDLTVLGSVHVSESVDIRNSLYVGEDTFMSGSTNISKNLTVGGKGVIDQDLDVHGNTTIDGKTTVKNDLDVKNNLTVTESISGNKDLYIARNANLGDFVKITKDGTKVKIEGDLEVTGYCYFHHWGGGNLSSPAYNNNNSTPNYALAYERFGTQDTGSYDTGSQSDARLKKNPLPIFDPLYKLDQVRGYEFDWAEGAEKSGHDVGLIAQELQAVYPEAVAEGRDGYLRIDYSKLVPLLVEAIRELRCQVTELQNRR